MPYVLSLIASTPQPSALTLTVSCLAALCWGIKFLSRHQDVQGRLREALETAHSNAATTKRLPTAQEIAKANVPYFDAVIEEIHRRGHTAPGTNRRATCDTTILGYHIPKGTDVFMVRSRDCQDPSTTH